MFEALLQGIQTTYHDQQSNNSLTYTTINESTSSELTEIMESQEDIEWNHCIRGGLTLLLRRYISNYFKDNRLGKKYTTSAWDKHVINGLWTIHLEDWNAYCQTIFTPNATQKRHHPQNQRFFD